ncbi:MAG: RsmE family RNA methyltransferase [bacterium]
MKEQAPKHRVFIRGFTGKVISDPGTVRHLVKVLRLREGDIFTGYDGGREMMFRVAGTKGDVVTVDCIEERTLAKCSNVRLTVAQALLKGKRWDIFLEKMVELGAGRIVPLMTVNTVIRLEAREIEKKVERWHKIAQGAAAQSGGGCVPEITEPMDFSEFLNIRSDASARCILAAGGESVGLREFLSGGIRGEIIVAVGPEGDFTSEELDKAKTSGFVPVSLGYRIFRSETAAIVAAVIILYEGKTL